jgi:hypothetical protein
LTQGETVEIPGPERSLAFKFNDGRSCLTVRKR